jgi:hypothetical protein
MNRIFKTEEAPEVLRTKGVELRDSLIAQADAGNTDFCFDNKVYAHDSVKEQMMADQLEKPCVRDPRSPSAVDPRKQV